MKIHKTNAMRLLDQGKVTYQVRDYSSTGALSGLEVAEALGQNPDQVFKTLVTVGKSGGHYVFVIPVVASLDLKKAARAVGEKHIAMIKERDLLPLTGYVHGGCSPLGMKKTFPTHIHVSAWDYPSIMVSAGKIGLQLELDVRDLASVLALSADDLIE